MAGLFAREGMRDFMQNGFAHLFLIVRHHEVYGKFDAPFVIPAEAERALAPVPCKNPTLRRQEMGDQFFS
jgi:hypothetical protein